MSKIDWSKKVHHNFLCAYEALLFAGNELEVYTIQGLSDVHQQVYTKLAGEPACTQKCSKNLQFRKFPQLWCPTCVRWRNELQQHILRLNMTHSESWKWQNSYKEIASLCVPQKWSSVPTISDVSYCTNIWKNCKAFKINEKVLQELQTVRNELIAHSSDGKLSDDETTRVFDAVESVFKDRDVIPHIDAKNLTQHLLLIKNQAPTALTHFIKTCSQTLEEAKAKLKDLDEIPVQNQTKQRRILKYSERHVSRCIQGLIVAVVIWWLFPTLQHSDYDKGCFQENYEYPFQQDLPLIGYFKTHKPLIGREWLFAKIQENIDQTKPRGVLLLAQMGYGKSALISHLLCAKRNEKGRHIRDKMVAFHICKFDVKSTRNPARFIRRMIGFFATRSPEYGSIISMLPTSSIIFDMYACEREIEACFDAAILNPLKEIEINKTGLNDWIIVVDALDECYDNSLGRNPLKDILFSRIKQMPKWTKLLLTSRNFSVETRIRQYMHLFHLSTDDLRNIEDMKMLILSKFPEAGPNIDRLTDISEGNFLYMVHALDYMIETGNMDMESKIPSSLEEIYDIYFDRQFAENDDFEELKPVFEIICAALVPMKSKNILKILYFNNITTTDEFNSKLKKIEHYVVENEDGLTFIHKSMHDWMVSAANTQYSISQSRGHTLISKYLFSEINTTHIDKSKLIKLAIHVVHSHNDQLYEIYQSLEIYTDNSIIHELIRETPSLKAMKLILHYVKNLEHLDEAYETAAFVAAKVGHLDQLQYLIKLGANWNFTKNYSVCQVRISDLPAELRRIKKETFSSYGLLHVASYFNRTNVVKYLVIIMEGKTIIKQETVVGQTALDIACEYGFIDIASLLLHTIHSTYSCLHYSVANGHMEIVEKVLKTSQSETCISVNMSKDHLHVFRSHNNCSYYSNGCQASDSLWLIFMETPLHTAVKRNDVESVQLIIAYMPEMLKCTDYYGYTPALLSLRQNRKEVFETVIKNVKTDVCGCNSDYINGMLTSFSPFRVFPSALQDFVDSNSCPAGGNFAHVGVINARLDRLQYLYDHFHNLSWNNPDNTGIYPVHYAAKNGFVSFINSHEVLQINLLTTKTENGSTVFHLAGLHKNEWSMRALLNISKPRMLIDNYRKTILHYTFSTPNTTEYPYFNHHRVQISNFETQMLKEFSAELHKTDINKRNIIHYILLNGYSEALQYILQTESTTSLLDLFGNQDVDQLSPVQYALKHGQTKTFYTNRKEPYDFRLLLKPKYKRFFDESVFYHYAPWEICVYEVLSTTDLAVRDMKRIEENYILSDMFTKSSFIFTVYLKTSYCSDAREQAEKQIVSSIQAYMKAKSSSKALGLSMSSAFVVRPDVILGCNKTFDTSPLNVFSLLSRHGAEDFLLPTFEEIDSNNLQCEDINGLTVYDYSLLSGNPDIVRFILQESTVYRTRILKPDQIVRIIKLLQFRKPSSAFTESCDLVHSTSCIDTFLSNFLDGKLAGLQTEDFCKNYSNELSLVHYLALNGMVRTLEKLSQHLGKGLFKCTTKHNITPRFIASAFANAAAIGLIEREMTFIDMPYVDEETEDVLMFSVLYGFPQIDVAHPLFCLLSTRKKPDLFNNLYMRRRFACLQNVYNINYRLVKDSQFIHVLSYYIQYRTLLQDVNEGFIIVSSKVENRFSNASLKNERINPFKQTLKKLFRWNNYELPFKIHLRTASVLNLMTKNVETRLAKTNILKTYHPYTSKLLVHAFESAMKRFIVLAVRSLEEIFSLLYISFSLMKSDTTWSCPGSPEEEMRLCWQQHARLWKYTQKFYENEFDYYKHFLTRPSNFLNELRSATIYQEKLDYFRHYIQKDISTEIISLYKDRNTSLRVFKRMTRDSYTCRKPCVNFIFKLLRKRWYKNIIYKDLCC